MAAVHLSLLKLACLADSTKTTVLVLLPLNSIMGVGLLVSSPTWLAKILQACHLVGGGGKLARIVDWDVKKFSQHARDTRKEIPFAQRYLAVTESINSTYVSPLEMILKHFIYQDWLSRSLEI